MVSYLSLNAESFVCTRGASLAGEDSRVRFLLVRAMVKENDSGNKFIAKFPPFTYRKNGQLPCHIACGIGPAAIQLGHPGPSIPFVVGPMGHMVIVERLGVGQDEVRG